MLENNEKINGLLKNLIAVFGIILVGLIAYSNSFDLGWHFDDEPNILNNIALRDITNIKAIWQFDPSRFVTMYSLAFNYYLGNVLVFGYHIVNLLIHIVSAIFVWWFVKQLFNTPALKEKDYKNGAHAIPFFAALIFISHPVQTQAVTYIVQRAASLAAMFYIGTAAFYLKFRLAEKNNGKRIWFFILAVLFCAMGMFSKEIVFTLPLLLIVIEFCFFYPYEKFTIKKFIPFLLMLPVIPLVIIYSHPTALKETAEASGKISSFTYLLTQFSVIVTYLKIFVFPAGLNLDYDFPIAKSFFEIKTLLSFLFLVLTVIAGFAVYKKQRLIAFGIFWFFITLAVESSLLPIKDVIYEHRLYLPIVGLLLVFLVLLYNILNERNLKIFFIINIIIVIIFSVATYHRNFVWENELSLWTDVVQKSPYKYRPYINRGLALLRRYDVSNAKKDFLKALQLDSTSAIAYCNIGVIYGMLEEQDSALVYFNRALHFNPNYEEAYNNRGSVYHLKGEYDKALHDFNAAILIKPSSPNALNNRATLRFMQGNYDAALADYYRALNNDKSSKEILKNIGLTLDKKGEHVKAIEYYTKALSFSPNYPDVLFNRAVAYYVLKKYDLSEKDLNKMRKLGYEVDADFNAKIKSINDGQNQLGKN